jgi:FkbM family methyltransferase
VYVVIEAGARWGLDERWKRLGDDVRLIGFEPDEEECARLNATADGVEYVPLALGAEVGDATLYLTVEPACASMYPPDPDAVAERPEHGRVSAPIGETTMRVTTLERWAVDAGVTAIDILKLDTQGSELGVLQGAGPLLDTIRFLQIEVEFNPMYTGQPLFGDVDRYLRERGFVLWRLGELAHYGTVDGGEAAVPLRSFYDSRLTESPGGHGQLFWGEAYFVRRDLAFGPTDPATAERDATIASAVGFEDLAQSILARAR